jgi:protein-disulfide isomerase
MLFENQGEYGPSAYKEFAESLKLDVEQFGQCLESGKFKTQIQEDFREAIRLGATGTPYFFINGVPITGARPQAEFEALIEAHLAAMAP